MDTFIQKLDAVRGSYRREKLGLKRKELAYRKEVARFFAQAVKELYLDHPALETVVWHPFYCFYDGHDPEDFTEINGLRASSYDENNPLYAARKDVFEMFSFVFTRDELSYMFHPFTRVTLMPLGGVLCEFFDENK